MRNGTIYVRCSCLLWLLTIAPPAFSQDYRSPLILAPYALNFGRVMIGTATNPSIVTIFNNGIAAQQVSAVSITRDFSETNNCPTPPATLAVNADCEIQVTFKPSMLDTQSGTLTISEAPSGIQLKVELAGVGTVGKPIVTISPSSLRFSEQPTGVDSSAQTVTVTNTGTEMLSLSNVGVVGDFMVLPASTCTHMSGPLGPNAGCSVEIVFAPLLAGSRSGQLVIQDNAEHSPQKVPLNGTGK